MYIHIYLYTYVFLTSIHVCTDVRIHVMNISIGWPVCARRTRSLPSRSCAMSWIYSQQIPVRPQLRKNRWKVAGPFSRARLSKLVLFPLVFMARWRRMMAGKTQWSLSKSRFLRLHLLSRITPPSRTLYKFVYAFWPVLACMLIVHVCLCRKSCKHYTCALCAGACSILEGV